MCHRDERGPDAGIFEEAPINSPIWAMFGIFVAAIVARGGQHWQAMRHMRASLHGRLAV
jgi:hypothetical protein